MTQTIFDRQPVLPGRRVSLRPLRRADHDALFAVASDPLIWAQHPVPNRYQLDQFDDYFTDAVESGGALVITAPDGRIIGATRFHGFDADADEVEIGWSFLAREHWGGAINREVKTLMLEHAHRSVARVIFIVGPNNHRSQRALEKLGAQRAGERAHGDEMHVVYEIRRPD